MPEWRSPRVKDRARLHEVIPLDTPFQLVVDLCNVCNFACKFCPTGHPEMVKDRPTGLMSMYMWRKIVEDMRAFPRPFKRVDFGKDGEQLLHPRFNDMVVMLDQSWAVEMIAVATNGRLLSLTKCLNLGLVGVDLVKISVEHVSDSGYGRLVGRNVHYSDLVQSARWIHEAGRVKVHAKLINSGLTEAEVQKFYDDFSPVADFITIEEPTGWTGEHGLDLGRKSSGYLDLPERKPKKCCPFPFYTLAVNWNGLVSVCCVDWQWDTVVGDLRTESLLDVWNGERLRAFRRAHLRGERPCRACAECHTRDGLPDNLDPWAEEIDRRLTGA